MTPGDKREWRDIYVHVHGMWRLSVDFCDFVLADIKYSLFGSLSLTDDIAVGL